MVSLKIHVTSLTWSLYGRKAIILHFLLASLGPTKVNRRLWKVNVASSRKFLFATDEEHYTKLWPIKIHIFGVQGQWIHLQNFPNSWGSRNNTEETVEILKEPQYQGLRCKIVFPSYLRKYLHKILLTWLPKYDLNKDNTIEHVKLGGEKIKRPQL